MRNQNASKNGIIELRDLLIEPMKTTYSLFLFFFISMNAHCQTLNIKGGMSHSTLKWETGGYDFTENTEPLISFAFFTGIDYFERDYFFMSSDLGYIRNGTDGVGEYVNRKGELVDEVDEQIKIDYLTANTIFNVMVPIKEKLIPYVGIGPRLDYLVRYEHGDNTNNDHVHHFNFGLNMGGGIKYAFAHIHIGLSSYYILNFKHVADWDSSPTNAGGTADGKSAMFLLTCGYSFE